MLSSQSNEKEKGIAGAKFIKNENCTKNAEDLLTVAERKEAINGFRIWQTKLEEKGMKINMEKIKALITEMKQGSMKRLEKYPWLRYKSKFNSMQAYQVRYVVS